MVTAYLWPPSCFSFTTSKFPYQCVVVLCAMRFHDSLSWCHLEITAVARAARFYFHFQSGQLIDASSAVGAQIGRKLCVPNSPQKEKWTVRIDNRKTKWTGQFAFILPPTSPRPRRLICQETVANDGDKGFQIETG